jgi:hypothetical protein
MEMTESKTTGRLSISRRVDPGNVPAPWVPPELPASTAAPGGPVVKRDRTSSPPAPWVPAELPATAPAPVRDLKIAKRKPWVPSELPHARTAPRNLPAADVASSNTPELKTGEVLPVEPLPQQTTQAGPTIINIVNQVAAPAPVYGPWWWGWWGGCGLRSCPHRVGLPCRRFLCWLW